MLSCMPSGEMSCMPSGEMLSCMPSGEMLSCMPSGEILSCIPRTPIVKVDFTTYMFASYGYVGETGASCIQGQVVSCYKVVL